MLAIKFDGLAYQLPECWREVNPESLPQLLQLVYFTPASPEAYHTMLQIPNVIRSNTWRAIMKTHFSPQRGKKVREANAIVLHELIHQLRWMYTEPIHEQPFACLEVAGQKLLLPEKEFLTMSFGELSDAYIHFLVWIRQLVKGDTHLDLLVATCRPERPGDCQLDPGWNGDKREPYNEFMAREQAGQVARLEPGEKMAVLLYFTGTMQNLLARYQVFDGQDGEPEEYPGQGWIKNQHLLAEKGIFGNMQQVKSTNIHEVMLFLEENKKGVLFENERRKQQENE